MQESTNKKYKKYAFILMIVSVLQCLIIASLGIYLYKPVVPNELVIKVPKTLNANQYNYYASYDNVKHSISIIIEEKQLGKNGNIIRGTQYFKKLQNMMYGIGSPI